MAIIIACIVLVFVLSACVAVVVLETRAALRRARRDPYARPFGDVPQC